LFNSFLLVFFSAVFAVKSAICQTETAAAFRAYELSFLWVFVLAKLLFPLFVVCCWQGYWVESFLLFGLLSSLSPGSKCHWDICEWVRLEADLGFCLFSFSGIYENVTPFCPIYSIVSIFLPQQVCFMGGHPFLAYDIFTLKNFALGSSF